MLDVEVRETNKNGKGIFANKDFQKGEEVLVFKGSEILEKSGMHTLQIGSAKHLLVAEPWRYVNHSCNPNCGIKNKVILVAMKDIKKGEEITFDYAMTEFHFEAMKCLCDFVNCRGEITGFCNLPDEIRDKYKRLGFISEYLLK